MRVSPACLKLLSGELSISHQNPSSEPLIKIFLLGLGLPFTDFETCRRQVSAGGREATCPPEVSVGVRGRPGGVGGVWVGCGVGVGVWSVVHQLG